MTSRAIKTKPDRPRIQVRPGVLAVGSRSYLGCRAHVPPIGFAVHEVTGVGIVNANALGRLNSE